MWYREETRWTHWHLANGIFNRIELAYEGRKTERKCQPDSSLENNSFWFYVVLNIVPSTKVGTSMGLKANFAHPKALPLWPLSQSQDLGHSNKNKVVPQECYCLSISLCRWQEGLPDHKDQWFAKQCLEPRSSWLCVTCGWISPGPRLPQLLLGQKLCSSWQ